ncbi:glyoxylate/hydroxypyruvate reductase A [Reyranella sp. CPCC 100927]|uniref:2-hydroxyacid dehydrogenase n=1 Tax=Reyranella sp. CPCC 100927 TaxID=2599616 RepID=UPI0011B55E43|nr:glyoxylate/hydroxypyruvate reductase A [Reyranella sp. CPCC 100927]TWT03069.1 glyoxylate/hydroxypyruvate reductase A [Reyranella sp. CPCC 100927]
MAGAFTYVSNAQGGGDAAGWRQRLGAALDETIDLRAWPDVGDTSDVEIALAWKPPAGVLARFPNLKLIVSTGMGVDHLLVDPDLPADVPIVRVIDPGLVGQMAEYAIYWTLHYHRDMESYAAQQRQHLWRDIPFTDTATRRVGVMGLGEIGADTARKLALLGFATAGWSRSPRTIDGVTCFHGADGFEAFLKRTDVLIDVLPMTPQTAGLLNARTLGLLPPGAVLINMARGGHVVDRDLIAALDGGHLSAAVLDVFHVEPLPGDHPFWAHPKIKVTPHIAGPTNPRTAAESVADNVRRLRAGRPLLNQIDRAAGY